MRDKMSYFGCPVTAPAQQAATGPSARLRREFSRTLRPVRCACRTAAEREREPFGRGWVITFLTWALLASAGAILVILHAPF